MDTDKSHSAEMARRKFLEVAGAVALGLPALIRARAEGGPSKRQEKHMEIKRAGSQPSGKGPAEYFAGSVRIDPMSPAHDPSRVVVGSVTFEPGARTAWHTHPLGQILIVTAG